MEKSEKAIFVKGKEAIVVTIILLIATIIFIVPIILIFLLKALYKFCQVSKEKINFPLNVESRLEKVY
jgi:hypothetical protein